MLKNMKIGLRLATGFCLVFSLMLTIIGVGVIRLSGVSKMVEHLVGDDWKKTVLANDIIHLTNANGKANLELFLITDQEHVQQNLDRIGRNKEKITGLIEQMEERLSAPEERALVAKIKELRIAYVASFTKVSGMLLKEGNWDEASRMMEKETLPALNELHGAINELVVMQDKLLEESGVAARQEYQTARTMMIGIGIAALLFGGAFAYWITRSITRPLRVAVEVANQVATGDLTADIQATATDETGQLLTAMQNMTRSLNEKAAAAEKLAQGNLAVQVQARSDKDVLSRSFELLLQTLQGLIAEINRLVQSAKAGELGKRGDLGKFHGGYREVVQGINDTLEAIVTPVGEAVNVLEKVAARDLTARVTGNYQGDYARIKNALNQAAENLDAGLSQVAVGAEQVVAASMQISSSSQSLASGASAQASSLQEVSSSLQQMAAMTRQNAENAKEARSLSDAARASAERGADSMNRLSQAIDKIKESSDQTAKIVKTIDEIAFQTNLLALNAAVEAARAGDAGKGFAVVAEEVRNLAMRSAEAAKNTATLIETSVKNAQGGVAINQEVLKNLQDITMQVSKVTEVMAEIAAASDQQRQGVDQLTSAVEQINQVTQQNAANAEQSASASEELSSQSAKMKSLVGKFILTDSRDRVARGHPPRAAAQPASIPVRVVSHAELGRRKSKEGPAKPDPRMLIPLHDDVDQDILKDF
jgi:methyl-accepting chemotaxis protein